MFSSCSCTCSPQLYLRLLQGLEEFGGVLEQEPNLESLTVPEPALDPEGSQEPPLNASGGEVQAAPADGGMTGAVKLILGVSVM